MHDDNTLEQQQLDSIEDAEVPDIIVSIEEAARIKNVSENGIRDAIRRGELEKKHGVTLSSLRRYKVKRNSQLGGKARGRIFRN